MNEDVSPNEKLNTIRTYLKETRLKKNISQKKLATLCGFNQAILSDLEHGIHIKDEIKRLRRATDIIKSLKSD